MTIKTRHDSPPLVPVAATLRWLGRQAGRLPGRVLIGIVQLYRFGFSPVMAPSCRYWPSCSEYAIEALRSHGAARGSWLTAKRLCRCHPWSAGGIDEVPAAGSSAGSVAPRHPGARHVTGWLAGSIHSNNRWRAYQGDGRRNTSDSPFP